MTLNELQQYPDAHSFASRIFKQLESRKQDKLYNPANDIEISKILLEQAHYLLKNSEHIHILPLKAQQTSNNFIYTSCEVSPKINPKQEIHLFFPKNDGNIILLSQQSYNHNNFQQAKQVLFKTHYHSIVKPDNQNYQKNDLFEFIQHLQNRFNFKENWKDNSYILTDELLLTELNSKSLSNNQNIQENHQYDFHVLTLSSQNTTQWGFLNQIKNNHSIKESNSIDVIYYNHVIQVFDKYQKLENKNNNVMFNVDKPKNFISDYTFHSYRTEMIKYLSEVAPFYVKHHNANFKPLDKVSLNICLPRKEFFIKNDSYYNRGFQPSMLQIAELYSNILNSKNGQHVFY